MTHRLLNSLKATAVAAPGAARAWGPTVLGAFLISGAYTGACILIGEAVNR